MESKIKLSHLPDKIIVNKQISLRAFDSKYFEELKTVVQANNVALGRRLLWAREDLEISYRDFYEQAPSKKLNNEQAHWHIFLNNSLAGAVNLRKENPDEEKLEIGYWLATSFTGKGIVTTCVNLLTDLAFESTNTPLIEISFNKTNLKSVAVAERAGYTFDREIIQEDGVNFDQYYKMAYEHWAASKQN